MQFRTGVQIIPEGSDAGDCVCCGITAADYYCTCETGIFGESIGDYIASYSVALSMPNEFERCHDPGIGAPFDKIRITGFNQVDGTYVFTNQNTIAQDNCNLTPANYTADIDCTWNAFTAAKDINNCPSTENAVSSGTVRYRFFLFHNSPIQVPAIDSMAFVYLSHTGGLPSYWDAIVAPHRLSRQDLFSACDTTSGVRITDCPCVSASFADAITVTRM